MKYYWKSISISLFIVLSIGTFYIQSSFAANEEMKIRFKKTAGDESEVNHIILSGDYQIDDRSERLEITAEKTRHSERLTFLQLLKKVNIPSGLEELVGNHKSFMRSKNLTAGHFSENEKVLAYAEIKSENIYEQPMKDLVLAVQLLDKQSEKAASMEFDVPKREKFSYMGIEKTQLLENELRVIVKSIRMDESVEFHAYTVQLDEEKLVKDHVIASVPAGEDGWPDLQLVNDVEMIRDEPYLLLQSSERYAPDKSRIGEYFNEYTVYDVKNNTSQKIKKSKEMFEQINYTTAVYDSAVFFPVSAASGIEVNRYDIETDTWTKPVKFELAEAQADEYPYISILNGKLYAVFLINKEPVLVIGDLKTGEVLYKGLLEVENESDGGQLYIFDVVEKGHAK